MIFLNGEGKQMESVIVSLRHPSCSSIQETTSATFDFRCNLRTKAGTEIQTSSMLKLDWRFEYVLRRVLFYWQPGPSAEPSLCSSGEFLTFYCLQPFDNFVVCHDIAWAVTSRERTEVKCDFGGRNYFFWKMFWAALLYLDSDSWRETGEGGWHAAKATGRCRTDMVHTLPGEQPRRPTTDFCFKLKPQQDWLQTLFTTNTVYT